ncbi:MAG: hypothetical protein AB8B80_04275 [Marinicellaceae bacterium]
MKIFKNTFICFCLFYAHSSYSGDEYKIDKATTSSSGGTSNGGNIQVKGSIGQAEASNQSTGGVFAINGGIWTKKTNNDIIFKNGFEN